MPALPWLKEWNEIIRRVIFADKELKELMLIPEDTDIITFIDKYFVRAGASDTLVENEKVRIVYGTIVDSDINNPKATRNSLQMDIYVKKEYLHNADRDRLLYRTQLIARRLIYLLMKDRYVHNTGYRFFEPHEADLATRTIGYQRYNVSFKYIQTY